MRISRPELLRLALTHRSYLHVTPGEEPRESNERLEFLGDSVLGLVCSDWLYRNRPDEHEGLLTKTKSLLVSKAILSRRALAMGLGRFVLLSNSEVESGGRQRLSILADAFEAVIGAIYIDQGLEAARQFIETWLLNEASEIVADKRHTNYKSLLQEYVQSTFHTHPIYRIRHEHGPDHLKQFTVEVMVGSRTLGEGRGRNKKEAEQSAARNALERVAAASARREEGRRRGRAGLAAGPEGRGRGEREGRRREDRERPRGGREARERLERPERDGRPRAERGDRPRRVREDRVREDRMREERPRWEREESAREEPIALEREEPVRTEPEEFLRPEREERPRAAREDRRRRGRGEWQERGEDAPAVSVREGARGERPEPSEPRRQATAGEAAEDRRAGRGEERREDRREARRRGRRSREGRAADVTVLPEVEAGEEPGLFAPVEESREPAVQGVLARGPEESAARAEASYGRKGKPNLRAARGPVGLIAPAAAFTEPAAVAEVPAGTPARHGPIPAAHEILSAPLEVPEAEITEVAGLAPAGAPGDRYRVAESEAPARPVPRPGSGGLPRAGSADAAEAVPAASPGGGSAEDDEEAGLGS